MRNFSSLLKDSLGLCKKNFIFLLSAISLSYLPGLILGDIERWFKPYLLSTFYSILANLVLYGAIRAVSCFLIILGSITIVVAIQNLNQGQHTSISSVYRQAIKLFLPVLLVLIIMWLIILGGLVLLIVPGVLFFIWYSFLLYAVVVHKKRGAEALALSKAVARTSMGKVIGYVLLAIIVGYGPSVLFSVIVRKGAFPSFLPYLGAVIIHGVIHSILYAWVTTFLFMFYIDLIEANLKISECFNLNRMEYEKTT